MGQNDAYSDFYVKMTKCRLNVHGYVHAKGSSDTPTDHADKLLLWSAPHLTQRGQPHGILNGLEI